MLVEYNQLEFDVYIGRSLFIFSTNKQCQTQFRVPIIKRKVERGIKSIRII